MNEPLLRVSATPKIMPEVWGPARFTVAEFEAMVEAGAFGDMKVELIDGELFRAPLNELEHSRWHTKVVVALGEGPSKSLSLASVGIVLGRDTVVACDAAVLARPVDRAGWLVPVDLALVVEAATITIGRDLGIKRELYAKSGIPAYWVVDPARATTHVFSRPVDGEYADVRTVPFDQPLPVPGHDTAITLAQ